MGRWLLAILLAAALFSLCAVALLVWYDGERVAARIAGKLREEHGVVLEIDRLERTLAWRPVVDVRGLRVANARHRESALVEVGHARFRLRLSSLLFGPLTLDDIDVSGVRFVIPYDRQGVRYWEPVVDAVSTWLHRFDWSINGFDVEDLTLARRPETSGSELLVSADRVVGTMPRLSALTLAASGVDANLETTLPIRLHGTATLDRLTLSREDGALPMRLHAAGRVEDEPLAIDIRGGNLLAGDPRERDPVEGRIRLDRHELQLRGTMSRDRDRHVNVAVDVAIREGDGRAPVDGRLQLSDPGDSWRLDDLALRQGDSTARGDVVVTRVDGRRHLKIDLELEGVDYPRRQKPEDDPREKPARQDGQGDLYAGLLEFIERFDADLAVRVTDATLYGAPLADVATHTSVNRGTFEFRVDRASVLGGRLGGSLTVVPGAGQTVLTLETALQGGDAARLLAGIELLDGSRGRFDGDVRLRAAGRSTADVLSSIDGHASLYLENGAMPDEIATWLAGNVLVAIFADFDRSDRTPVNCAVVEFAVRDGQARSQRIALDTGSFAIVGEGDIDIPGRRLSVELAPRTNRFSLLSLRLPLSIAGPFDDIEVETDKSEAAVSLLSPIDTRSADVTCSAPVPGVAAG